MASISNRQKTCAVLAALFMLVVMLVLGLVVAPMLEGSHKVGWIVVAFLVIGVLVSIFTITMLHRAEERERQALATLPPGQKK